jgi:hypothetical protein
MEPKIGAGHSPFQALDARALAEAPAAHADAPVAAAQAASAGMPEISASILPRFSPTTDSTGFFTGIGDLLNRGPHRHHIDDFPRHRR